MAHAEDAHSELGKAKSPEVQLQRSWFSMHVAKECLRDHLENTRRILLNECDHDDAIGGIVDISNLKPKNNENLAENIESLEMLQRELELAHLFLNACPSNYHNESSNQDILMEVTELNRLVLCHLASLLEDTTMAWQEVTMPKRTNYLDIMYHLICHNVSPTVCVKVDENRFHCRSMMLCSLSNYFYDCKGAMTVCLPSTMVSSRNFVNICGWMMEPLTVVTMRQLLELVRASDYLELRDLYGQCMDLTNELMASKINVISIYTIARSVYPRLAFEMLPLFGQMWLPFSGSKEFIELSFHELRHFVISANLGVNTEIELFYTLMIWMDYKWDHRKRYISQMLQIIKFDNMPYVFLLTLLFKDDGPAAFQNLLKDVRMKRVIEQSLINTITTKDKFAHGNNGNKSYLIYDPCCKYHHRSDCKSPRYATFEQFMDYWSFVRSDPKSFIDRVKNYTDASIVCCPNKEL